MGEKTGRNLTDRGKPGTKRSLLVEGVGVPLSVAASGANTHDRRLVEETLDNSPIDRPSPEKLKQNLCMDKGDDDEAV